MWAGGGLEVDEGPLDALRAWGATEDVIDDWRKALHRQARESGVSIWPEHWYAWNVFLAMRTQWRVAAAFGGLIHTGLDYAALPIVLDELRDVQPHLPLADLMPQLRMLEESAREQMNT